MAMEIQKSQDPNMAMEIQKSQDPNMAMEIQNFRFPYCTSGTTIIFCNH
jgi:hypothetical protein